ncbi:MAG: hypothetical protein JWO38_1378 [Gemmataceae bacterium]|nr:hypothetical protein [Gemmataceae bacterium]
MTVQELRETLTRLVGLLQATDAKAATTRGLSEFVEATAPFGDLSLKAFVKLAEAGRTPPTPKPGPAGKSKLDPAAVAAEVKNLYDRAADPAVTEEQMRLSCGKLGSLTKEALVRLAESIQLYGMKTKNKGDIVADITHQLVDRKGAAIRRQLMDRPSPPANPAQGVTGDLVVSGAG